MWTTRKLRRNWRGRNSEAYLCAIKNCRCSHWWTLKVSWELLASSGVIKRRGSTFLRTATRRIILEIIKLPRHSFSIRFERIAKVTSSLSISRRCGIDTRCIEDKKNLFFASWYCFTSFSLNANQQALRDNLQRKAIKVKVINTGYQLRWRLFIKASSSLLSETKTKVFSSRPGSVRLNKYKKTRLKFWFSLNIFIFLIPLSIGGLRRINIDNQSIFVHLRLIHSIQRFFSIIFA